MQYSSIYFKDIWNVGWMGGEAQDYLLWRFSVGVGFFMIGTQATQNWL